MLNNDFDIIDKYDDLMVTIKPEKTVFVIPSNFQEQIDLLDAAITGLDVSISGGNVQGVFVNLLNQLKADLLGGDVPTTLDTLKELATKVTQLDTDKANVSEITAALSALESAIALRETILDNDSKLAAKADITYVDNQIASVGDGSPKGTYATLVDLETAYTEGATGIYVVAADGHWYYWNGTAWTDGGVYQATEFPEVTSARQSAVKNKTFTVLKDRFEESEEDVINGKKEIKQGAVSYYYGTNLFDGEKDVDKLLNSSGGLEAASSWATTGFIAVPPSTEISISEVRFVCEYDINKRFIAGTYQNIYPRVAITLTTNARTEYIKYTNTNVSLPSTKCVIGSTTSDGYRLDTPVLSDAKGGDVQVKKAEEALTAPQVKVGGKNHFNPNTAFADTVLNSSGNNQTSSSWTTSDYIEVEAETAMTISKARCIAEYDQYKRFITGTYQDIYPQTAVTFTTNVATKYIRVTSGSSTISALQIEIGSEATAFETFYLSLYFNGIKIYDLKNNEGEEIMATDYLTLAEYEKYVDREKYQIWKALDDYNKVRALYKDIAVKYNSVTLTISISTTGINGNYDNTVIFNDTNFPNLIAENSINSINIIPWTRNFTNAQRATEWRMFIITSKGQIYHNFPSRSTTSDGSEQSGDITKFEESVVWDLPERKFPSTDPEATGTEIYFPCLPASCYEHHPLLNTDASFVDTYGNGGFGKSITKDDITFGRFYVPGRASGNLSFTYMGGYEPDDKITLIGTYNSNSADGIGTRTCVFATDDGGRQWYNKFELSSEDEKLNTVNTINTSALSSSYTTDLFIMKKRTKIIPTAEIKDPPSLFSYGSPIVVSSITKANPAVVTTASAHDLATGNVIVLQSNTGTNGDWEWMLNDTADATTGGNGIMFKIKKLTDTTFELHDFIHNPHSNLPCRHIHHINRIKDGWIMGTGETYPSGWLFYAQMKQADSFIVKLAHQTLPFYRLTSTPTSVQRLLGGILLDDINETFIAAIDSEYIARTPITLPTGKEALTVSRSSTGIYRGKLSDIDDLTKFECIYPAKQVAYYFKEKAGAWMFVGQRGEFAISFDKGATWEVEDIGEVAQHFRGESKKYIVNDNFIFIIK